MGSWNRTIIYLSSGVWVQSVVLSVIGLQVDTAALTSDFLKFENQNISWLRSPGWGGERFSASPREGFDALSSCSKF
jgi:hypothetical protein